MTKPVGAEREPDFCNPYSYLEIFYIFEIFAIDNLPDNDWRKPIVDYLENPLGKLVEKQNIEL